MVEPRLCRTNVDFSVRLCKINAVSHQVEKRRTAVVQDTNKSEHLRQDNNNHNSNHPTARRQPDLSCPRTINSSSRLLRMASLPLVYSSTFTVTHRCLVGVSDTKGFLSVGPPPFPPASTVLLCIGSRINLPYHYTGKRYPASPTGIPPLSSFLLDSWSGINRLPDRHTASLS